MKLLQKPRNSWCLALYILHDTYETGVSLGKVLLKFHPTFYKFQSRLGEVAAEYPGLQIEKTQVPFKSSITGKIDHYTQYRCTNSRRYLVDLYNKINEEGFAGKTQKQQVQLT